MLRLVHLRVRPLATWLDAAVIMGRRDDECALMQLSQISKNEVVLEVMSVKQVLRKNKMLIVIIG